MVTLPSILVDSLLLLLEPGFQTPLLLPGCRFCLKMIIIRSTKLWSYVQNNLPESTSFKNSIPAKPPPHLHLHLVPLLHPLPRFWKKKRVVFQCFVGYKTRLRGKKHTTFSLKNLPWIPTPASVATLMTTAAFADKAASSFRGFRPENCSFPQNLNMVLYSSLTIWKVKIHS